MQRREEPTHDEIVATIAEIVQAEWPANAPTGGLSPETKVFYEGLGLDSIDGVTLVLSLEERFEIAIDQDRLSMEVFETVGTLASFIAERLHDDA